jgi:dihydrodipicolinate synthase/N-acetylneuraminate lyase
LQDSTFQKGTSTMAFPDLIPWNLLRPRRKIVGMSAVLLPYAQDGSVDWPAFRAHVLRTAEAGLTPAVNMDTGYVNLLDFPTFSRVVEETHSVLAGGPFVAGAAGAFMTLRGSLDLIVNEITDHSLFVQGYGGLPIVFQSPSLTELTSDQMLDVYRRLGQWCSRFLAFELGTMFAPFGKIYDLDTYAELLRIPQCIGAKHSSLNRQLEWQRLELRNRLRPDFLVLTGNDLAIDMVMYGSDYLLGLSTFAPDLFAKRDALWEQGDPAFFELNDLLQYLGHFVFRAPVPAYKHSAAMFLKLRDWITSDHTHPASPERPASDRVVLQDILERLRPWLEGTP